MAISQTFTVLSSLALARCLPSGLNATLLTGPACPFRTRICWSLDTSHNLTVLSVLLEASNVPSGLKDMLLTAPVCPFKLEVGRPVIGSQNLTECPSSLANSLPSGLNATVFAISELPLIIGPSLPLTTSQSLTVPSSDELAKSFPSG